MADRQLLKVALGAFGLDSEIDKKAFIRKILEEGTTAPTALANRLTDKSYHKLSAAFGFGDPGGANTGDDGFAAKIVEAYKTRAFEAAVGEVRQQHAPGDELPARDRRARGRRTAAAGTA